MLACIKLHGQIYTLIVYSSFISTIQFIALTTFIHYIKSF